MFRLFEVRHLDIFISNPERKKGQKEKQRKMIIKRNRKKGYNKKKRIKKDRDRGK